MFFGPIVATLKWKPRTSKNNKKCQERAQILLEGVNKIHTKLGVSNFFIADHFVSLVIF